MYHLIQKIEDAFTSDVAGTNQTRTGNQMKICSVTVKVLQSLGL
jgi:hypothetical protein